MEQLNPMKKETVNCRIGSLEMVFLYLPILSEVNCRIGSLERWRAYRSARHLVNCRIGSLEIKSILN